MSVAKIKIVSIIGMMKDLDKVVKVCGRTGFFEPDNAGAFYSTTEDFLPITEKNPYTTMLQLLRDAMISSGITPKLLNVEKFEVNEKRIKEYVSNVSSKISDLVSRRNELNKMIDDTNSTLIEAGHFTGLDLNLNEIFACKFIKVRFGKLPKESYLKLGNFSENPYVLFFPCTSDDTHYFGVYFSPVENVKEIDRIFASLYFERIWVTSSDETPEKRYNHLREQVLEYQRKLKDIEEKINLFWKTQKDQCMRFYSKIYELNTYFEIKKYALKYKDSFILVGWVPLENQEELSICLDSVDDIEYSIDKLESLEKYSPPVKLKNNVLVKPFEFFVDMYGLPSYGEIDPTPFVAITYILLFGIMFGDVGQGLVLALAGHLMWKFKNMKLGKILVPCGISASIFGLLYGEVFGSGTLLNPLYSFLGFREKPFEVMHHAVQMIGATIILGVFLILISMMMNIYSSLKQKHYENAIFSPNGLAGFIFYLSLILGVVFSLKGVKLLGNVFYIGVCLILPIIVIFFREPLYKLLMGQPDWKPEKLGEFILQNFFEIFEVLLSYATNSISFLRVGAYVLSHAGLMTAVYTVAGMIGPPMSVGYLVVVIFGNAFVIALEGLLSGIQALRLEFYEIFSRFFNGQGRAFNPVDVSLVKNEI